MPKIFEKWHECARNRFNFNENPDKFWTSSIHHTRFCDSQIKSEIALKLQKFHNKDEDKYLIFPRSSENFSNFLTIGIGKDVIAESQVQRLAENLTIPLKFYGADPNFMDNFEIFSKIGTYFPLAISGSDGFFGASVLFRKKYQQMSVFHVELNYFLKKLLKISKIDFLWMDGEYSEYTIFPYFAEKSEKNFERNGIIVCQINMEVHKPKSADHKIMFKNFIQKIIEDRKFALLKQIGAAGHYRLFLFNFGQKYCVEKFVE
ncbi:unnamed protein product [Caenorhabditis angaria]|uniref:Methyltransferase FkbM domain-containing protein n=1 Tax=Caenorhabditis angaria TaxID=860376 RepID=A0A9P1J014_9PELO|nr:unnamed protein product [Caenorhabditis angaria]